MHVSSGAASNSYVGWGPYCVTKSGLNMMYRCLSSELCKDNILVGSAKPGVVDTPMQDGIRQYAGPSDQFPMKTKFDNLHETCKLEDPNKVATYFHWLLSEIDDDEYIAQEWDIRDIKDDSRWIKYTSKN